MKLFWATFIDIRELFTGHAGPKNLSNLTTIYLLVSMRVNLNLIKALLFLIGIFVISYIVTVTTFPKGLLWPILLSSTIVIYDSGVLP